jgi:hypothetical protein
MNEIIKYVIAGFTSITLFTFLFWLSPVIVFAGVSLMILFFMSLMVGYVVIDTYETWKATNEKKNK